MFGGFGPQGLGVTRRRRFTALPSVSSILGSSFEWIDPTIAATIAGSPVAIIKSPNTAGFVNAPNFQRSTLASPADRPAITASRLVFDGVDDVLDGSAGYTYVGAVTPGDPAYAQSGKGPTTVGLCVLSDGRVAIGHYGKLNETTQAGETFHGSICVYPSLTRLNTPPVEHRFTEDFGLATVGVQGIIQDPQSGNIWAADTQNGRIYELNLTTHAVVHNFAFAGGNGLAYDTLNNRLIVCLANSATVTYVNKSTGATISTFTIRDITNNTLDHIFFDGTYGSAGALYATCRDNGVNGRIIKYDIAAGYAPIRAWSIQELKAAEGGLHVAGSTFYMCDDEYYHNQAANVNRVITITVDDNTTDYGTRLVLAGVAKIAATPGATVALLTGGDALTSGGPARKGVGLFYTITANQFRLITRNLALQAVIDWAITSTTTEYLYYIDIDNVAHTATLYVNGVLISTQTDNTNLVGSIPRLLWTLGASYENTALPSRFSNTTIGGFIATPVSNRQAEIEGYLSWQTQGSGALLPGGHAYKNAAPV